LIAGSPPAELDIDDFWKHVEKQSPYLFFEWVKKQDINGRFPETGNTIMLQLFQTDNFATTANIRTLINLGADVNLADNDSWTPLMMVLESDPRYFNKGLVKLLINAGADVNAKTNLNETVLHFAVQNYRWEDAKLLLEAGANPIVRNAQEESPLAFMLDHIPSAKERKVFFRALGAALRNLPLELKLFPLFYLIMNEQVLPENEWMRRFSGIAQGISTIILRSVEGQSGNTILSRLVAQVEIPLANRLKAAKVLLDLGVDPLIKNRQGLTAIDLAPERELKLLMGWKPPVPFPMAIPKIETIFFETPSLTTELFDPIMNEFITMDEYLRDPTQKVNLAFLFYDVETDKVRRAFIYPRNQLQKLIDTRQFFYQCVEVLEERAPRKKDLAEPYVPFIKLAEAEISYVEATQLQMALSFADFVRYFVLTESGEIDPTTSLRSIVVNEWDKDFEGNRVNIVSADHCQKGTRNQRYEIFIPKNSA